MKAVGAVLALGIPSFAAAASTTQTLLVNVPFSFVMAGKEFAPGTYRVEQNASGLILIRGGEQAAMSLSIPASFGKAGEAPGLRFASSNDQEYLVGVNGEIDRLIPLPKAEGRKITVSSLH
ncbi:MAG: hypothetical protein JO217_13210 [Acidobacteriaceae bacterium]|nr:hypothetical protein [Acidobacteriaceae bacterium]